MSNYSDSPNDCRVDFFKTSGKWYDTISVRFREADYEDVGIHLAFERALRDADAACKGMQAICLDPYHKNSHPISIIWRG